MKNNLNLINMRDVPIEPVQWLWYPYIPIGKLTMVQGDPGDGKTTFVLAVIAALTKAGNSHLRKLLVETAQVFGRSATKSGKSVALKERQAKCDSLTVAYADKANARLKKKYFKIAMRSKVNIAKTAVAREMACFIWGMMTDNISCA